MPIGAITRGNVADATTCCPNGTLLRGRCKFHVTRLTRVQLAVAPLGAPGPQANWVEMKIVGFCDTRMARIVGVVATYQLLASHGSEARMSTS